MRTIVTALIAIPTAAVLVTMQSFAAQRSGAQSFAAQAKAEIRDEKGQLVGQAMLTETAEGVQIRLVLTGVPQGTHAFHIHETGKCDPPTFTTAGPDFNPQHRQHGIDNPLGRHAGDLANITVPASGRLIVENVEPILTLKTGVANSLLDADGSAFVIHLMADDNKTDPAGNAGARIACGVITKTNDSVSRQSTVVSPQAL